MQRRPWIFWSVCALLPLVVGSASAVEVMIGIVPSDGTTLFVKRFSVTSGSTIQGVTFRNNDSHTVFPEVLLVRDLQTGLADGTVVGRTHDVREGSSGLVEVTWAPPVQVSEAADYYVAVRIPAGPGKEGPGVGPGLGAVVSQGPISSFVAGGSDGELTALRVDLSMALTYGSASKARPQEPASVEEVQRETFLDNGTLGQAVGIVTIRFGIARPSPVSLDIYDVAGRRLRRLLSRQLDAGVYFGEWDGRDEGGSEIAVGIYIARLRTNDKVLTRKIILVK